jgi:hypothetical protein
LRKQLEHGAEARVRVWIAHHHVSVGAGHVRQRRFQAAPRGVVDVGAIEVRVDAEVSAAREHLLRRQREHDFAQGSEL